MKQINNQPPNNVSDFITLGRRVIWNEFAVQHK